MSTLERGQSVGGPRRTSNQNVDRSIATISKGEGRRPIAACVQKRLAELHSIDPLGKEIRRHISVRRKSDITLTPTLAYLQALIANEEVA